MQKNDVVFAVVAMVLLWLCVSWYWYVCSIKGMCEMRSFSDENEISTETVPVDERNDTFVRDNERGSSSNNNQTVVTEEVVIDCDSYLDSYIRYGYNNNAADVRRLEQFLNDYEEEDLTVDGVYGRSDEEAVKRFQLKYRAEVMDPWGMTTPTGYVFRTTRDHVNTLHCAYEYARENQ